MPAVVNYTGHTHTTHPVTDVVIIVTAIRIVIAGMVMLRLSHGPLYTSLLYNNWVAKLGTVLNPLAFHTESVPSCVYYLIQT